MIKKIRILLADDLLIAREGWKRILEAVGFFEVVGEAKAIHEILKKIRETNPDILLMDLKWLGDVIDAAVTFREIKNNFANVKIIAFTAYENLISVARSVGADAVLMKTFTRDELIGLIEEMSKKETRTTIRQYEVTDYSELSRREQEVLDLVAEGRRDREIASMLGISSTTAKNHVKSILEKLGAMNRTQAVLIAREKGLITID